MKEIPRLKPEVNGKRLDQDQGCGRNKEIRRNDPFVTQISLPQIPAACKGPGDFCLRGSPGNFAINRRKENRILFSSGVISL